MANTYVRIPNDLTTVTTLNRESEVAPNSVDLSDRAVANIWSDVEDVYRSGAYPAVTFCLRRKGEIVLNRALGHSRGNGPQESGESAVRTTPETPMCLFSASKAVTAILALKLAEEGGIDIDKPVAHYIPEFGQNGKSKTTVSQVLSHHGGFPMFDLPKEELTPERLTEWDFIIETLCKMAPEKRGKPRMGYHAITGGYIVGEIIKRVTGDDIQAYNDRVLRQPLGMKHFSYGLPQEHRADVALNYEAGMPVRFPINKLIEKALNAPIEEVVEVSNSDIFYDAIIPAGNMFANAEEMTRFYQMLLNRGEWNGQQILKPETTKLAVKPLTRLKFDHTLKIPMRYSQGLMLGANPYGAWGPMTGSAFGHIGFANIMCWADPKRDLTASLLVSGKAVLGSHLLTLGKLTSTIAWQCR
ncbi:MAG: serine hydrolase [Gammaproteobacteria bacterium]|nr:serine hydrolase [Gammaproteobacteria bacterium]